MNRSYVAREGAKVFVSCWKPPMAMRMRKARVCEDRAHNVAHAPTKKRHRFGGAS
jgi:hypothetical protein